MARLDVTDAEWAVIEPLLPVAATGPLPRRVRDQFNGVLWRFRAGSGWRDVPDRYGPWSTVYSRFSTWARAGVFQDLMDALIAEAEAVPDAEKVPRATVGGTATQSRPGTG